MRLVRDRSVETYEIKKMMLHEGFSAIPTDGGHLISTVWLSEYAGENKGRPLDPSRAHTAAFLKHAEKELGVDISKLYAPGAEEQPKRERRPVVIYSHGQY